MTTLTPAPFWATPVGVIATTSENATFAFSLDAAVTAAGAALGGIIAIGADAASVVGARVDGASTSFSVSGSDIIIPVAATDAYYLDLATTLSPTFSLLNGSLPLGLTISPQGQVAGVVGNIEPVEGNSTRDFRFTVRARYRQEVRDRTFTIRAAWDDSAPAFSEDLFSSYQVLGTLASGGLVEAFVIGPVSQGRALTVAFDASDADGPPPPASLIPRDVGASFLVGIPDALSWNAAARRIEGVVRIDADVGTYLFDLVIAGAQRPLNVGLIIVPREANAEIEPVLVVSWITPSGNLGNLRDGDLVALAVRAATSTGAPVTYEIVGPDRDALAARGLFLDPQTGEFHGRITAGVTETLSFVIRARSALAFDDRSFSLTLTNRYSGETISIVSMDLTDRGADMLALYDFQPEAIFRPRGFEDADHGIPARAEMYLVGGLAGDADAVQAAMVDGASGLPRSDYHGVRDLLLGPHALYVARLGNRILYEVLARTLIDPYAAAGGFADDGSEVPIPNPVRPSLGFVRPQSVRNARFDLIKGVGMAAAGADSELLPLWLRSRQRNNAPAPGFVACLPLAFLTPNAGAAALAAAKALETNSPYPNGMSVRFTNYRVEVVDRSTALRSATLLSLST